MHSIRLDSIRSVVDYAVSLMTLNWSRRGSAVAV